MKKPRLMVTDHAVIRYLERVGGFNIEGLRRQIGQRCDMAHRLGASSAIIDGHAYLISDGQVITVLEADVMINRQVHRRTR